MSLIHWWPLNGDYHDQGVNSNNLLSSGGTFTDGKIGQCLQFNSGEHSNNINLSDLNGKTRLTISFWLKIDIAAGDFTDIIRFYTQDGGLWRIESYSNSQNIGAFGRGLDSSGLYFGNYTLGVWRHFLIIIDGEKDITTSFVNGVQQRSRTLTAKWVARGDNFQLGETAGMSFNDVRIYDHVLSQKEIHEVSKGLFTHYTLSNVSPKTPGDVYTMSTYNGATGKYGNESNISQEIIYYPNPEGANKVLKISNKTAGNNWNYMFFNNIVSNENTKKVLSFDFFADVSTSVNFYSYRPNYIVKHKENGVWVDGGTVKVTPFNWNHIVIRWEGHNAEYNAGPGYMQIGNGIINTNLSNIWYIANIRVNDGDEPTGTFYDVSGGGLFTSGSGENLIIDTNSRYYQNCIYFNGLSSYIDTPIVIKEWAKDSAISLNFWIKPIDNETRSILGTHNYHWIVQRRSNGTIVFNQWNSSGGHTNTMSVTSKIPIPVNQWSMITVVWTGSIIKLFINAQYDNQVTATLSNPNKISQERMQIGGNVYAWGANGWFKGFLSDVRMYATTLSDSDILRLYNTSKTIDNHGNFYTKMFDENAEYTNSSISKKGIQKISALNENGRWTPIMYHDNKGGTNLFNEKDKFDTELVYHNNECWSNFPIIKNYGKVNNKWHFKLLEQKDNGQWIEYEWRQSVDPYTATFSNTGHSTIECIKNIPSNYGGMYRRYSLSYFVINNSNDGNWFGALGCWNTYQTGIPSIGGSIAGTKVLWIETDQSILTTKEYKNGLIYSNSFNETL